MDPNWNNGATPQNQNFGAAPTPQMPPVNNPMPNMAVNPAMAGGMPTPQMPTNMGTVAPINQSSERKGTLIETIILVIVCLIAAAAIVCAVMFYMNWNELQVDFDIKMADAVAEAEKTQKDLDEKNFTDREKLPNRQFAGPSDYGTISFYYPKTWSVYVASDSSNNSDYEAYFAPVTVNPIDDEHSRYALRFIIRNQAVDDVLRDYNTKVNDGEMTSKVFNADNNRISGTLFQGTIEENMNGIVLVIKVNDKTAILQTDAETFRQDYEALINTLRRNS